MKVRPGEMAALAVIQKVLKGGYMNLALEETMREMQLQGGARAAAVAISRMVIENLTAIDFALSHVTKLNRCKPRERNILRIGAARILYTDMPAGQAVNSAVEMCAAAGGYAQKGFVNATLRAFSKTTIPWPSGTPDALAIRYSWPVWACEEAVALLGMEQAEAFLRYRSDNGVTFRVNPRKMTREDAIAWFVHEGMQAQPLPLAAQGIRVLGVQEPTGLSLYREGFISLQSEASMVVASLATPSVGAFLDACAAPGGKTCAVAEKLDGTVYAADVHPHRVALIQAQVARLGLPNVQVAVHDATQPFTVCADSVLVDAPCSGLGTASKRPDVKLRRTETDIATLAQTQRMILQAASQAVKPGGKLVYATCTFLRQENEQVVEDFLRQHTNFTPINLCERQKNGMMRLWPQVDGTDAFFVATMERKA